MLHVERKGASEWRSLQCSFDHVILKKNQNNSSLPPKEMMQLVAMVSGQSHGDVA